MEHLNNIINSIRNISLDTIIDIWIAIGIFVIFKIISGPIAYTFVKMFNFRIKDRKKLKENGFYRPLKTFLVLLGIYIALSILGLPVNIFATVTKIFKICTIILTANGIANLFNTTSDTYLKILEKLKIKSTGTTMAFISKVLRVVIYITAGFMIITDLGYNLGGFAAGLGISSVFIALAAQDLVKSFLAGISILTDRPFEIGDSIESKEFSGTVEDITLRTTRLRDVYNQIVIIPNNKIIDSYIINTSKKEKRRYNLSLTFSLETSLEKISALNNKLKTIFESNENIFKESIKVIFNNISPSGIEIVINFYTEITDSTEYAKFKEELNYTILDIINKEKINLA